jgi:hypothetical protein
VEDDVGLMNASFRPDVYRPYYKVQRHSFLLFREGTIQKQERIIGAIPQRPACRRDGRLGPGGLGMSCAALRGA